MSDVVGKATLEFGADNSGVKSAVQEVGREVNGMASVAAAAAVKASGSLKGIGAAGEGAAQKLSSAQQRARQSFRHGISDAAEALAEHAAIVDAIAAHDPDAAEKAMREHLDRVLTRSLAEAE